MGWALRGSRWAQDTSDKQFSKMNSYHNKAHNDVLKALELNPKIMHAYFVLINIIMGEEGDPQRVVDAALKINPYSYYVRSAYLRALLPRWGGSMDRLQAFISQIKPYYVKNPRLKALEGRYAIETGDDFLYNKQYAEALKSYQEALALGDSTLAYIKTGNALARLQRQSDAIEYYNKALTIDPLLIYAMLGRAESYYYFKKYDNAKADITTILELNPYNACAVSLSGSIHFVSGQYEEALKDFERATDLDPMNKKYQNYVSSTRNKLQGR
jgi:tetratricopeptide (TPR) repeat protein